MTAIAVGALHTLDACVSTQTRSALVDVGARMTPVKDLGWGGPPAILL